ncbi:hypothetical protein EYC58_03785 [Candidatus Saccharibacteria bacterium]|nr:MAG: hypothetical protein EYC58_03785 [Candidatus Saccharibacteria bacterium]
MFTISEHEQVIQGILEDLTSRGESAQVLSVYSQEVPDLQSAKSHHWAAIAYRELKDVQGFNDAWRSASACQDYTPDIRADFHRDHALLLNSTGSCYEIVERALSETKRYRTPGSIDSIVDELAIAKIQLSRDEYTEAWRRLQKTMSDFYDRDSEQIMSHAQLHRDLVWWRMLAAGLSGNGASARGLGRNICFGWSLVAKEVKPRRRVIAGIVMVCPSFVQRRLIERLLSQA